MKTVSYRVYKTLTVSSSLLSQLNKLSLSIYHIVFLIIQLMLTFTEMDSLFEDYFTSSLIWRFIKIIIFSSEQHVKVLFFEFPYLL